MNENKREEDRQCLQGPPGVPGFNGNDGKNGIQASVNLGTLMERLAFRVSLDRPASLAGMDATERMAQPVRTTLFALLIVYKIATNL